MNKLSSAITSSLLSNNPLVEGILLVDTDLTIVQANQTAHILLSRPEPKLKQPPTLAHTPISHLLTSLKPTSHHPDFDGQPVLAMLTATLTTNQPQRQTISLDNPTQDQEQWLLFKAQKISQDGFTGLIVTVSDITKQYHQDQQKTRQLAEIADQNRQWQAIFNGVQESLVVLDTAGYVISTNPATERITGRKGSQVIGHHVGQLFPKVDPAVPGLDKQGRSGILQVMQDGRPSDLFEAVVATKDNRHIWINYTYTPLRDPKGEITGFVRVTSDVSTVKAVDQMKNDFISIASHELRTPLGVINSYINLFLNDQLGPLTPDQRLFMQRLYHSSSDMSALVEDLLNMSRIEDGRIDIALQPFNLADLVTESLSHLEPRYKAKHITITINQPSQDIIVHADKQKIEQALTNLIDNAIKYTYDNGSITITVDTTTDQVTIAVSDSGVGIRPENLTHIFEKFYREGNPLSIKEGGSGLGLYISRKLVELHGGTITATSAHNKGSTFTVYLPVISPDRHQADQEE